MAQATPARTKAFISYSHEDVERNAIWVQVVERVLEAFKRPLSQPPARVPNSPARPPEAPLR